MFLIWYLFTCGTYHTVCEYTVRPDTHALPVQLFTKIHTHTHTQPFDWQFTYQSGARAPWFTQAQSNPKTRITATLLAHMTHNVHTMRREIWEREIQETDRKKENEIGGYVMLCSQSLISLTFMNVTKYINRTFKLKTSYLWLLSSSVGSQRELQQQQAQPLTADEKKNCIFAPRGVNRLIGRTVSLENPEY